MTADVNLIFFCGKVASGKSTLASQLAVPDRADMAASVCSLIAQGDLEGLTAQDCIFVGDGGGNEVVGARNAGLYTFFFSSMVRALARANCRVRTVCRRSYRRTLRHSFAPASSRN